MLAVGFHRGGEREDGIVSQSVPGDARNRMLYGGEPSVASALTVHELQVSLLVADGASNREAAAGLFLSTKTIEAHPACAFHNLGVHSRTQPASVLRANSDPGGFIGSRP